MVRAIVSLAVVVLAVGCGGSDTGPGGGIDASVGGGMPCVPACGGATPFCQDGVCVADCPGAEIACDGMCIDASSDPTNCGRCGEDCGAAGVCDNGICSCPADTMSCPDGCVDVMTDRNNCGFCENDCNAGEECIGGTCVCAAGTTDCGGGVCADVSFDPLHCGMCGMACADVQMCRDDSCECRPGTLPLGDGCVNPEANPASCFEWPDGTPATCEGATPLCEDGVCVADCSGGRESCGGGCVDTNTDPQNCGDCGEICAVNEVCSNGDCREFAVAVGCDTCPCDACGGDNCCAYPGGAPGHNICVDGDCPAP